MRVIPSQPLHPRKTNHAKVDTRSRTDCHFGDELWLILTKTCWRKLVSKGRRFEEIHWGDPARHDAERSLPSFRVGGTLNAEVITVKLLRELSKRQNVFQKFQSSSQTLPRRGKNSGLLQTPPLKWGSLFLFKCVGLFPP